MRQCAFPSLMLLGDFGSVGYEKWQVALAIVGGFVKMLETSIDQVVNSLVIGDS